MWMWIVFAITFVSHVGLILIYERQRKLLESLRASVARQRHLIRHLEGQIRIASGRLFK